MNRGLVSIALVLLAFGWAGPSLAAVPVAVGGVFDAAQHDFAAQPILELKGEWWFWHGEFVEPHLLAAGEQPLGARLRAIPNSFSSREGFFREDKTGYATVALQIVLPPGADEFEVGMAGVNIAHRMAVASQNQVTWISGRGQPGATLAEEVPSVSKVVGKLASGGTTVSLWFHLSNHRHARGGIWTVPSIGKATVLQRELRKARFESVVLTTILLTMALYHFMVFAVRRADKANLWLALTCFFCAMRQHTVGEDILSLLLPGGEGYAWSAHFEYLGLLIGPACAFSYVATVTHQPMLLRLERYFWGVGGLFILGTLATPPVVFTEWLVFEQLWILVLSIVILFYCARLSVSGHQEARLILLGFAVIALGGIHDVIKANQYLPTPFVVGYAFALFALIQSFTLAKRASLAYDLADRLSAHLKEEVSERTEDLREQKEVAETALDSAQQALRQLSRAHRSLVQAEKISALGSLVGGVAHELNNPLNFVRGNQVLIRENAQALEKALLGMLPDNETGDELRGLFTGRFNNIYEGLMGQHEGVERAASIVDALRGFATDQVGDKVIHDIHTVLRPAIELSRDTLKGIDFGTDLPVVMPIECNPAEICQLVMQLLNNAAYAVRAGGTRSPRVRLEVELLNQTIELRVIDNGPGIDHQVINRIFDPFVTTKPVGSGTGMGLAMAVRVVLDHQGTIDGQNTDGGTVFTVCFPTPQFPTESAAVVIEA